MKVIGAGVVFLSFLFCALGAGCVHSDVSAEGERQAKTRDVNNDGTPDVTYSGTGDFVETAEADTDYDGRPDVTVRVKDGQFESAEIDTDKDGAPDKKISDVAEFNQWLNENNPDFNESLNRPDWQFSLMKF